MKIASTKRYFLRHPLLAGFALALLLGAITVFTLAWPPSSQTIAGPDTVVVYKRASCNCCAKWVSHLEQSGFKVQAHNVSDLSKQQNELGTPPALRTCHTAVIGRYSIEGHVPASDIRRLLAEEPQARGLAVPGMPIGSPGMEMGARRDPYATLLVHADGRTTAFAQHGDAR